LRRATVPASACRDAATAANPYSRIRSSYPPIAASRSPVPGPARSNAARNCPASCSAVFAPEPRAGLIAWIASPSTVTRLGVQAGTGVEVRIRM
jgi:hypothetical protein